MEEREVAKGLKMEGRKKIRMKERKWWDVLKRKDGREEMVKSLKKEGRK